MSSNAFIDLYTIKQESLSLNHHVTAGGQPMYLPHAARYKILYVEDVLNINEEFASNTEVNTKYHTNLN
jgi:hypothetical protein